MFSKSPHTLPRLLGIAVLSFLAACKQQDFENSGTPEYYQLAAPPAYLYTDSDLANNSYWLEGGPVVPICGASERALEVCPKEAAKALFVRKDQAAPIGLKLWWTITHLRLDAEGVGVSFKPSVIDQSVEHLRPAVWFEGTADDQIDIWVTPAQCRPMMTFVPTAQSEKYSISCRQESPLRSRISVRWDKIVRTDLQWLDSLRLEVGLKRAMPSSPTIVLDPGHGYSEDGTRAGSWIEKDMTVAAAVVIKSKLQAGGAQVFLTREPESPAPSGGSLRLIERIKFAAQRDADLFVSLHFDNWQSSYLLPSNPSGLTCYYQHWFSAPFAAGLCGRVEQRGWKTSWVVRRELGVLGSYRFPSVLLELANLAEPADRALIADKSRFEEYLAAIAASIGELAR